jgi:hypothetical protein
MSKNTTSAEVLDALLDDDESSNEGNSLAIFARIHERRRKRAHAKAKASQPDLGIRGTSHNDPLDNRALPVPDGCACHDCLLEKLRAFWLAPLTQEDHEASAGAMDYALQTVTDTLEAGDVEDAIFAMARVARKAWAFNRHLGPIEGFPKQEQE